jgi:hypothetical protein
MNSAWQRQNGHSVRITLRPLVLPIVVRYFYFTYPTLNAPTSPVSSLANKDSCWQASTECCELVAVC